MVQTLHVEDGKVDEIIDPCLKDEIAPECHGDGGYPEVYRATTFPF